MLNHEFSLREKILIIVVSLLAIGIFYYEFGMNYYKKQMALYDTTALEEQMAAETVKAQKLAGMKNELAEVSDKYTGVIAVYNNLAAEISDVGNITENKADNITVSWDTPILSGKTVRRTAAISFETPDYATAKAIIQDFASSEYRTMVSDLVISAGRYTMDTTDTVSVSLKLTYYETIDGATSTTGLVTEEGDSYKDTGGNSLTEELAHSKELAENQ